MFIADLLVQVAGTLTIGKGRFIVFIKPLPMAVGREKRFYRDE